MSRKGRPPGQRRHRAGDPAALKDEFYKGRRFTSYKRFRQGLAGYIRYWDTQRRQKQIGWRTPEEFRRMTLAS